MSDQKRSPQKLVGRVFDLKTGRYELTENLGGGTFGQVYAARMGGSEEYAFKIGKKTVEKLKKLDVDPLAEFEIMKIVHGIVPATPEVFEYGIIEENATKKRYPFVVMERFDGDGEEYMDGVMEELGPDKSTLRVVDDYGTFLICSFAFFARELCAQIDALEKRSYYHLDIKLPNMVYKIEDRPLVRVSVTDFGLACDAQKYKCAVATTYMPPEWRKKTLWEEVSDREELGRAQRYMVGKTIKRLLERTVTAAGVEMSLRRFFDWMFPAPRTACSAMLYARYEMIKYLADAMKGKDPRSRSATAYGDMVRECDALIDAAIDVCGFKGNLVFRESASRF